MMRAMERRHEITRLEAFSDAVFGFALTLLVVSLDVPRTYAELMGIMGGFLSFACCFALLIWIWYEHNMFFRRYGLQDGITVALNGGLLFVVLFYVYPLKFMFDSMFAQFVPYPNPPERMALYQMANASTVYALGFVVLFVMFTLLYARAYARRGALGLTDIELFDLKSLAGHHLVSASVGLIAMSVALFVPLKFAPLSPSSLMLMGPGHFAWGTIRARRRLGLRPADAAV
jgi:uncharacterized membrane protein